MIDKKKLLSKIKTTVVKILLEHFGLTPEIIVKVVLFLACLAVRSRPQLDRVTSDLEEGKTRSEGNADDNARTRDNHQMTRTEVAPNSELMLEKLLGAHLEPVVPTRSDVAHVGAVVILRSGRAVVQRPGLVGWRTVEVDPDVDGPEHNHEGAVDARNYEDDGIESQNRPFLRRDVRWQRLARRPAVLATTRGITRRDVVMHRCQGDIQFVQMDGVVWRDGEVYRERRHGIL